MNTSTGRDRNSTPNALKRSSFAADLSDDVIQALSAIIQERHFAPGDVLFKEGTPGDGFFILLSGRVNFTISEGSRRPRLVGFVEKGQAVGLSAIVAGTPHAVTAVAALKVSALFFPESSFQQIMRQYPELWLRVSVLLSAGVQQAYTHRVALCRGAAT